MIENVLSMTFVQISQKESFKDQLNQQIELPKVR